jgi:rRNA-processing protein FCF1
MIARVIQTVAQKRTSFAAAMLEWSSHVGVESRELDFQFLSTLYPDAPTQLCLEQASIPTLQSANVAVVVLDTNVILGGCLLSPNAGRRSKYHFVVPASVSLELFNQTLSIRGSSSTLHTAAQRSRKDLVSVAKAQENISFFPFSTECSIASTLVPPAIATCYDDVILSVAAWLRSGGVPALLGTRDAELHKKAFRLGVPSQRLIGTGWETTFEKRDIRASVAAATRRRSRSEQTFLRSGRNSAMPH